MGILPTSNHIFLKQTLRSFSDLFILFITLSFSPFSLPGKIFVITAEFTKGFGSTAAKAENIQLKLHSHTSAEQELADERQKTQHPWLHHSHNTHTHSWYIDFTHTGLSCMAALSKQTAANQQTRVVTVGREHWLDIFV